jgi:hypothetical protein
MSGPTLGSMFLGNIGEQNRQAPCPCVLYREKEKEIIDLINSGNTGLGWSSMVKHLPTIHTAHRIIRIIHKHIIEHVRR